MFPKNNGYIEGGILLSIFATIGAITYSSFDAAQERKKEILEQKRTDCVNTLDFYLQSNGKTRESLSAKKQNSLESYCNSYLVE